MHIGLVSGWQTENIGDVAHTPGVLTALQRYAPEAQLTLLARRIEDRERAMLQRYFPQVSILEDRLAADVPATPALQQFLDQADLLVHGSGPGMVASAELAEWHRRTAKPYGFFGVTVDALKPYHGTLAQSRRMVQASVGDLLAQQQRELLDGAAFVYCRDSLTLELLRGQGIKSPVLEFGPDATPLCDFFDDAHAAPLLNEYGLTDGQFLCAVPRLRFTPYYQLRGYEPQQEDWRKEAYNAAFIGPDLEALRRGITAWVRKTGNPALVVPEMSYAVAYAQQHLAGTFAEDVADRIHILPRYWELSEAITLYRHSAAVLSQECHAPLFALAEGIPAYYLRQPTDTIKGEMYHDLGLSDHVVELDDNDAADQVEHVVTELADRPELPRQRTSAARQRSLELITAMTQTVRHAASSERNLQ